MAAFGAGCSGKLAWLPFALTAAAAIGVLIFALSFNWHGRAAGASSSSLRGAAGSTADSAEDCHFDSLPATAFFWDPSCAVEAAGCKADGKHMNCRFCGAQPLVSCPTSSTTAAPVAVTSGTTTPVAVTSTTTVAPLAVASATTAPEAVTSATPGAVTEEECTPLYSDVSFNTLRQSFPSNPDTQATGFVFCRACTSGQISCNATVFGGRTRLIASHIHLADDGDGTNGVGGAVFNFCGDNTQGLLNDGVPYSSACSAYEGGLATMVGMEGSLVKITANTGMAAADRVRDIVARPERYFFNFHSVASWAYWRTQPVTQGMCRGQLRVTRQGHGGNA